MTDSSPTPPMEARPGRFDEPVRTVDDLDEPSLVAESVNQIADTGVIWIDEKAIRGDFPPLAQASAADLEGFILENASVLSEPQCRDNPVNAAPNITGAVRPAWRPPMYGRSVIVEANARTASTAETLGLLDLKGTGVGRGAEPMLIDHRNGLLILDEALEELILQRLIDEILRAEGVDVRGVPVYALVDLRLDARTPYTAPLPAVVMVRRAHHRFLGGSELPQQGDGGQKVKLIIELLLRRYGLTSTNYATRLTVGREEQGVLSMRYGGFPRPDIAPVHLERLLLGLGMKLPRGYCINFDCVNVQTTRELSLSPLRARLVDFGHYRFEEAFTNPVLSIARDRFMNVGAALWPQSPDFVQPEPRRRVDWAGVAPRPLEPDLADFIHGCVPPMEGDDRLVSGVMHLARRMVRTYRDSGLSAAQIDAEIERYVRDVLATHAP